MRLKTFSTSIGTSGVVDMDTFVGATGDLLHAEEPVTYRVMLHFHGLPEPLSYLYDSENAARVDLNELATAMQQSVAHAERSSADAARRSANGFPPMPVTGGAVGHLEMKLARAASR